MYNLFKAQMNSLHAVASVDTVVSALQIDVTVSTVEPHTAGAAVYGAKGRGGYTFPLQIQHLPIHFR